MSITNKRHLLIFKRNTHTHKHTLPVQYQTTGAQVEKYVTSYQEGTTIYEIIEGVVMDIFNL